MPLSEKFYTKHCSSLIYNGCFCLNTLSTNYEQHADLKLLPLPFSANHPLSLVHFPQHTMLILTSVLLLTLGFWLKCTLFNQLKFCHLSKTSVSHCKSFTFQDKFCLAYIHFFFSKPSQHFYNVIYCYFILSHVLTLSFC